MNTDTPPRHPSDGLAPGARFAQDYVILRGLGRGGMGTVYVARQESTGRERALKVLRSELAGDDTNRARFQREAQIGAQIDSAHIVQVIAAGVDDTTGAPWMAMELLRGQDLSAVLKQRGALSPSEVLAIFEQLGHGLGAAHRIGIVHRDIKPANLFIADSQLKGVSFTVKVLDLGIARLLHASHATTTGALGSPLWMAPEQADKRGAICPATDVWALGLLAFRLLTGKLYWLVPNDSAPDHTRPTLGPLLCEILVEPLVPASVRAAVLGCAGTLPPGFDIWFSRCVTRNPAERFRDATEAVSALVPVLRDACSDARALLPTVFVRPVDGALASSAALTQPLWKSAGQSADGDSAVVPPTVALEGFALTSPPDRSRMRPMTKLAAVTGVGMLTTLGAIGLIVRVALGQPPAPRVTPPPARPSVAAPATTTPSPLFASLEQEVRRRLQNQRADAGVTGAPTTVAACPEDMAQIAEGSFTMGSADGEGERDEHPARPVRLRAFCLDRTEVTVARYRACVASGACAAAPTTAHWEGITATDHRLNDTWCNGARDDRDDHPVNCVDWNHAVAYCRWAGRRLPTEAEWQYAARGAEGRTWPWGDALPDASRLNACGPECTSRMRRAGVSKPALYAAGDGWELTAPVGSFAAGATHEGLQDMAGNVWEWTADWYGPYAAGANDGTGPAAGTRRVNVGGGWADGRATSVRAANRDGNAADYRDGQLGFRCAREVSP